MYRKLKHPPTAFWEVTPLCNHNCVHCFNYWRTDQEQTLELYEYHNEIDYSTFTSKIIEQKPATVVITGGEPLLVWEHVKTAIEKFKEVGINVSLNTNAVLINDEIAKFFKEKDVKLLISFPCSKPEICNEIVNTKGAFDRIINGLDILVANQTPFSCNMVVSTRNLPYVKETALFLKEKYNITGMSITRVGKPVNASCAFDGYLFNSKEIRALIEISTDLTTNHNLYIDASAPYPACALETQQEFDIFSQKRLCSAGKTSYVIGSDGGVKACVRDGKVYGNIFTDDFDSIWDSMEEWRDGSLLPQECKECKSFDICEGGCRADQLAMAGDCAQLDSAVRLDKIPVPFVVKGISVPDISTTDTFKLRDDVIVEEENTGVRISYNGLCQFITEKAYKFLTENETFTIETLASLVAKEEDRKRILASLISTGFIIAVK